MSAKIPFAVNPEDYLEPVVEDSGPASATPKTIIDLFQETVRKFGTKPALCYKRRKSDDEPLPIDFKIITYNEYWDESMKFAKSLIHIGLKKHTVVNILGFNSHEWFISSIGSVIAGCVSGGIYATNSHEACKYVAEYSKAEVVVLEGNRQLKKFTQIRHQLPSLRVIVVWGESIDPALAAKIKIHIYSWDDFLSLSSQVAEKEVSDRWTSIKPGHCASLIFTSGTTGTPKGVMLSHDNLTWTSKVIIQFYGVRADRVISYLPLSHVAAQLIDMFGVMAKGGTVYFAQPDVMKGSLLVTLREVRPTFFFGVPRVFEKFQEQIHREISKFQGWKKSFVTWAQGRGLEKHRRAQTGQKGGIPFGYTLAKRLLFQKLKKDMGFECCESFFTAAAPIHTDTLWYLASLDIPVYEVFGQSECTGPNSVSSSKAWKIGYCGRPIPGSQNKIDPITGEYCYRGRHIFMGYLYMPKESEATFDHDRYLRSGDVAQLEGSSDPNTAFVKITGRIKEIIITAGGENIPPTLIENEMKSAIPILSHCLVIGDAKKYLTMILSVKVKYVQDQSSDEITEEVLEVSKQIGSSAISYSQIVEDPLWKAYMDFGVAKGNSKATSNAQIVQKWSWLPVDLCEKAGELTPTLKVKRKVVIEKYRDMIESMYT